MLNGSFVRLYHHSKRRYASLLKILARKRNHIFLGAHDAKIIASWRCVEADGLSLFAEKFIQMDAHPAASRKRTSVRSIPQVLNSRIIRQR